MTVLIIFAFLAGIVTILSPCILPVLPIMLSGGISGGKRRPFGIITGFILSFTFFTLFLSTLVKITGVSPDAVRTFAVVVVFFFGLTLLIPKLQLFVEQLFSKLASRVPQRGEGQRGGFWGGALVGVSLGLVWTPCVGPILASVISLALSGTLSGSAVFITLAYAIGTALPMLAIIYGGRTLLQKVPWLVSHTAGIQKFFGVIMIIIALALATNLDRKFQTYILTQFPNYGAGLTSLEDTSAVKKELEKLQNADADGSSRNGSSGKRDGSLQDYGEAPELIAGGKWFNSEPVRLASLRGKVVLVDFWTYTCINCIRTLPYLKTWDEKYRDKGLVIIGVHTPEFEFEKNAENVKKAIADFGLRYPVMQDNDYATWRAYNNRYWPAKYLIDKDGRLRFIHFGEGAYDESEQMIQKLLSETGAAVSEMPIKNPDYEISARTPELYLGYERIDHLVSPERIQHNVAAEYSAPQEISENHFAYEGKWKIGDERAMPAVGSKLILKFHAKEVFLVMRPADGKKLAQVRVLLDSVPLSAENAGDDGKLASMVGLAGLITVKDDRLYKLIRLKEAGVHTLTFEFLDDNSELFAFTFG